MGREGFECNIVGWLLGIWGWSSGQRSFFGRSTWWKALWGLGMRVVNVKIISEILVFFVFLVFLLKPFVIILECWCFCSGGGSVY